MQFTNKLNIYSNEDTDETSINIADANKKNDDIIKTLKESHQNEILKLNEIHRCNFLDLQDKTLKWVMSKSDMMQEHSRLLAAMREELSIMKHNYIDLKSTAREAFAEGTLILDRYNYAS